MRGSSLQVLALVLPPLILNFLSGPLSVIARIVYGRVGHPPSKLPDVFTLVY